MVNIFVFVVLNLQGRLSLNNQMISLVGGGKDTVPKNP
jgi:hypothetical protein